MPESTLLPQQDNDGPSGQEGTPLLEGGQQPEPVYSLSSLLSAHRRPNRVGGMFWVAEAGILIWFGTILGVVLTHQSGLFTFHPILQSAAVLLFYQGILVLQPTRHPDEKRTGLLVHESFQIVGSLSILTGTSIIIANKILHHAPHFTSWHGLLGLISLCLICVQSLFGALIGFEISRNNLLGDRQARKLWKYHRGSGYLIIVMLTLTVFVATESDWFRSVAERRVDWVAKIAPIISVFALLCLTNFRKIFPS